MASIKVSIHQPDFFPWLGFFHKVSQSDRFVVFEHVQAPRGKSWLSRNRILLNGSPFWLTLPVRREGLQAIKDLNIDYSSNFERKHLGTIKQAYGKARFFDEVYPIVADLYSKRPKKVMEFNLNVIREFCGRLRLNAEFVYSSVLVNEVPALSNMASNELVLELCVSAGGTSYVSGTGCIDFIKPNAFFAQGIEFWFQDFNGVEYTQCQDGPFIPNMSVLDALFSLGFCETSKLLKPPMLVSPDKVSGLKNKN